MSHLPESLVVMVMTYVPAKDILKHCCLVHLLMFKCDTVDPTVCPYNYVVQNQLMVLVLLTESVHYKHFLHALVQC